jgi:hypothetical protein
MKFEKKTNFSAILKIFTIFIGNITAKGEKLQLSHQFQRHSRRIELEKCIGEGLGGVLQSLRLTGLQIHNHNVQNLVQISLLNVQIDQQVGVTVENFQLEFALLGESEE